MRLKQHRLAVQRGVIVSLEQELQKVNGLRRAVVDVQRKLIDGKVREARELVSEVLLRWPTT